MKIKQMFKKILLAVALVLFIGTPNVANKDQLNLSVNDLKSFVVANDLEATTCTNPPGTYEFYPGTGYYPSGSTEILPWNTPAGVQFEGFETYANNEVIETSSNKAMQSHLEVTSGTLTAKYVGTALYHRSITTDYNFRMLLQGLSSGSRIKWTDQAFESRFYVDSWQASSDAWQGVHLFGRYRTENDLYVVSLRNDGTTYFKKKQCGVYTTLASGVLKDASGNPKPFNVKQWYKLTFAAIGTSLNFYVDGVLQLSVTDGTFSWGTMGIRTDYANVYMDDLHIYDDLSDF
ncbi:LamG domain-containing protein [Leptospira perolatii]|uniref:LamG domain-containing protein n=1 Tax=Leptospira perolatii TaxID=2023191 RepID=UPI001FAFDBA3|nr:LamG domain-containing protein [Leptospira perolatii]